MPLEVPLRMDMDMFLEGLVNAPGIQHGTGATEGEIIRAESELQIKIPADYRLLLVRVGWLIIGPQELFGLGAGVPPHLHLVRNAKRWRSNPNLGLPLDMLPIKEDGSGSLFCIRTPPSDEDGIFFLDHEIGAGQEPSIWSSDLVHFLSGYVELL